MKLSTLTTLVQVVRIPPASKRRTASDPGAGNRSSVGSPPASPRKEKAAAEPHTIRSCSGDAPKTHECLLEGGEDAIERVARLVHTDEFIIDPEGGVNAPRLLSLTRRELLIKARLVGVNALVDEEWTLTIQKPKRRGAKTRVNIHYTAVAARCKAQDPQVPVAIHDAQGLPGLMTVLERI
ncbi:hypothetical protein EXIGLDRAFT_760247 [Exidia glandulosa HHB12029]|uniref:Uncharacterized protein n=1 Tax=Exidia glandulosa HHB12029 TaxID=1314781 RepID=A0A165PDM1_EXIGL|nr:hypothetical protein EXIGLDRAFT_760247 [Exidia glandulosa HHB12029]